MTARRNERGAVAGLDALLFGVLILMAGAVLVINLWSVIETRAALDAAAREYLRSYTSSTDGPTAAARADLVARAVLDQRATPLRSVQVLGPDVTQFGPCQPTTVQLSATVPAVRLPFLVDIGGTEVNVTATELIPPHRELVQGDHHDPSATPCGP